ncbi:MAG: MraY family glycosyltransferase [Candidatus Promineifilaceae bacterium]|nr:MraY family glycosyltransferase [Candidatus Promineifilaceae bacterium]
MRAILAIFFIALTVTAVSTPRIRQIAINLGFVDVPAERKLQDEPIPLLGGISIIIGALLALLVAIYVVFGELPQSVIGVLLASSLVAVIGLIDDRLGLPAWLKLLGQFLGFLILIYFGIRVQLPIPEPLNYAITFLWLAGISNAINFLDNMDGLSAGISGVAAAFILLLAILNGQFLVSALAAAVLGACLGFLRYNFRPAKIYMGDAGSLFLGFLLAVLGIQLRFPENSNFITWMVPVLVLGIPIFDMTLVIISRLRRGISPNTAGRDHLSHRLVNYGFSQREAVLILYIVGGALGMIAIFITQATLLESLAIGGIVAATALAAIWQLETNRSFRSKSSQIADHNSNE